MNWLVFVVIVLSLSTSNSKIWQALTAFGKYTAIAENYLSA